MGLGVDITVVTEPLRLGSFVRLFDRPYFYLCRVLQENCVAKHIYFWCVKLNLAEVNLHKLIRLIMKGLHGTMSATTLF